MEPKSSTHVKTTVYIPRTLHDSAKLMAVFTHSSISNIIVIALKEKLTQLKGNRGE